MDKPVHTMSQIPEIILFLSYIQLHQNEIDTSLLCHGPYKVESVITL